LELICLLASLLGISVENLRKEIKKIKYRRIARRVLKREEMLSAIRAKYGKYALVL